MTEYFDVLHVTSYLILIIIGIAVFYQISRFNRLNQLKSLGFEPMLGSNESTKRRLRLIAPIHMEDPILPSEIKVTYNGLLVFWCVSQQIKKYKITCWCFRKCESNSSEPETHWFQAIHFDGISDTDKKQLLRYSNKKLVGLSDINYSETSMYIVYQRSLMNFSSTISLLKESINYLSKIED